MSRITQLFGLLLVFVVAGIPVAKADVVTWKDQKSGISLVYPDTWRQIHNQKSDDIFTIAAPLASDDRAERTQCRVRVREDRRFAIYPAQFAGNIQRTHVSRDFWASYAGEFQDTRIGGIQDKAFLGGQPAGYATMTFEPDNQKETGFRVTKRARILASQHKENLYILECSSQEVSFEDKWEKTFRAIASSVSFSDAVAAQPQGQYRDFLKDKKLKIHGQSPIDHYYY